MSAWGTRPPCREAQARGFLFESTAHARSASELTSRIALRDERARRGCSDRNVLGCSRLQSAGSLRDSGSAGDARRAPFASSQCAARARPEALRPQPRGRLCVRELVLEAYARRT